MGNDHLCTCIYMGNKLIFPVHQMHKHKLTSQSYHTIRTYPILNCDILSGPNYVVLLRFPLCFPQFPSPFVHHVVLMQIGMVIVISQLQKHFALW